MFYDIVDNNSKTVVQFQYSANQDQVAIDGGYRESVIFEISNNVEQLDLNDFDLQKSNMIYARYCNCRGKAGIFKVTSGKLKLLLKNDEVNFTLDFALNENPPLIDHIYVQKNKVK